MALLTCCKNKMAIWMLLLFYRNFSIVNRFLFSLFVCHVATNDATSPSA